MTWLRSMLRLVSGSARDLASIVLLISFFQLAVLRQPFPDLGSALGGMAMVLVGLAFFVRGLDLGLFPLGESMAHAFARKGSIGWLLSFAFLLGFGTTAAEPALMLIAEEASEVAAQAGAIANTDAARGSYALGLRFTVALAVGVAIVIGVWRILSGWPIHLMIASGYLLVVILTASAARADTSSTSTGAWSPISVAPAMPRIDCTGPWIGLITVSCCPSSRSTTSPTRRSPIPTAITNDCDGASP